MLKLKASELAEFRHNQLLVQGGRCALCLRPILDPAESVADHCHTTGEIRGILHRGCNSMLGKFENHMRIAKLTTVQAAHAWATRLVPYLHRREYTGAVYPTHKTAEEKRLARNAKARKTRAAKKVTT